MFPWFSFIDHIVLHWIGAFLWTKMKCIHRMNKMSFKKSILLQSYLFLTKKINVDIARWCNQNSQGFKVWRSANIHFPKRRALGKYVQSGWPCGWIWVSKWPSYWSLFSKIYIQCGPYTHKEWTDSTIVSMGSWAS